jgi:mannose-6-phosphate isomerase-like protein (cupin superfamily)
MKNAASILTTLAGILLPTQIVWASPTAPSDGVIVASAAQLEAGLKPTDKNVFVGAAPAGPGATALAVRRTADGVVEVHDSVSDILVAQKGKAVLMVGGSVRDAKQTGSGEWRGGTMVGGRRYSLVQGATVWIPAGVPHQLLIERGGSFSYLAFKFSAPK